jgi:hypothetical protein
MAKIKRHVVPVGWRIDPWRIEAGGFSRSQIHAWIAEGTIDSAKVGGARVILESPREFLERHRAPAR